MSIIFIPINKIRPLSYYLDNCIPPHRYFRVGGRVSIHIYKEHLKSTITSIGVNEEYSNMNKKSILKFGIIIILGVVVASSTMSSGLTLCFSELDVR